MTTILSSKSLGFHWETQDPFLFCAHHLDYYPKGTETLGPAMPLSRRNLGQDFDLSNDWKMYHGHEVPGFPEHPHRGFETVTVVLQGYVDHFDSRGASGRYGQGDVQWMTAGSGMQHAEMFPLVNSDKENTLHLFQIWLNLPRKDKFVQPHYKMLWSEKIPKFDVEDESGRLSKVTLIAGKYGDKTAAPPAPDSYAANPDSKVDMLLIDMEPSAEFTLPAGSDTLNRSVYLYGGGELMLNEEVLPESHQAFLTHGEIKLKSGSTSAQILILQAEPIGEPVYQYGPFVMNTKEEIVQAYDDYKETRFGGWPWDRSDPVHAGTQGRFAKYEDGRVETPEDE